MKLQTMGGGIIHLREVVELPARRRGRTFLGRSLYLRGGGNWSRRHNVGKGGRKREKRGGGLANIDWVPVGLRSV